MGKEYSAELKLETVKRIAITDESIAKVVAELCVKSTAIHGWLKNYKKSSSVLFYGSGKGTEEDEMLKKAAYYFARNLK